MKKLNKFRQVALIAVLAVALSITACAVNVGSSSVAVTGVTLDKTIAEVEVDKTVTLKATVEPANATNKVLTWTSDKTDIATVDTNGVVTGVKAGIAKITATTKDGGKTAICDVTVKSTTPPPIPESVSVTTPDAGVEGDDLTGVTLPYTGDGWKGVLIKGRKVKLSPYEISKTEVTYKLWKEVYDWAILKKPEDGGYTFANAGRKGSKSDNSGSENEPVTCVSWRDCIVWCNAYTEMKNGNTDNCVYMYNDKVLKSATEQDGTEYKADKCVADMDKKGFRLPTEAEWEYAARYKEGGALTPVNYLSGATEPCGYAGVDTGGKTWVALEKEASRVAVYERYLGTDEGDSTDKWLYLDPAVTKTAEVGSKAPNDLGLYDMSGNVWEWCFDRYGSVGTGDATDPQGSASGSYRVLRGGNWHSNACDCVVGFRYRYNPDIRYINLGFRLAWRP